MKKKEGFMKFAQIWVFFRGVQVESPSMFGLFLISQTIAPQNSDNLIIGHSHPCIRSRTSTHTGSHQGNIPTRSISVWTFLHLTYTMNFYGYTNLPNFNETFYGLFSSIHKSSSSTFFAHLLKKTCFFCWTKFVSLLSCWFHTFF